MSETMKAVRFHDYGGPEAMQLEEVPKPVPAAGQVLVQVEGLGINPVDWKLRSGFARKRVPIALPAVPGGDLSGRVVALGSAAMGFSVGDEIIAMIGLLGASAQYVALDPAMAAPRPRNLDAVSSAAIPLAALTAWQALFEHGKLARGQSVFIHAASGGVGAFAVQFARHAGANISATASPANHDYVKSLGAARVFDYHAFDPSALAGQFDLVLDSIGGTTAEQSLVLLKDHGTHAGVAPPPEELRQAAVSRGIRVEAVRVHPDGAQLREIVGLIESGAVNVRIAAVFDIAEIGRAHEFAASNRAPGKVVLKGVR